MTVVCDVTPSHTSQLHLRFLSQHSSIARRRCSQSYVFEVPNLCNSSYFSLQRPTRYFRPLCCNQTGAEPQDGAELSAEDNSKAKPKLSLNSLDAYFGKLKATDSSSSITSSTSSSNTSQKNIEKAYSAPNRTQGSQTNDPRSLSSLNAYFDKMQAPAKAKEAVEPPKEDENMLNLLKGIEERFETNTETSENASADFVRVEPKIANITNLVIGFNVAIFLLGIASPVQTKMVEVPLPLFYGAKINALIADGEWWRLITPMFLHDGLIHVGIGSWVLLSVGPAVEFVYGPAGFCMIYLLGGMFGNLFSFFHTPLPTVGGTGPIYALVAAWAVYVIQNRETLGKVGIMADLIQKAFITCGLHLILANTLPADNWTHIGATFAGALLGLLATPKAVEANVRLEDSNNKLAALGEAPELGRLVVAFSVCLGLYFCLYNLGVPAAEEALRVLQQKYDTTVFSDMDSV